MPRSSQNPWLHGFAVLTACATLGLIALGGLVTSHGVGMAVPDWPTTYGYNMFLFPISQWVGGIFYEHTHRLMASGVGLLTGVLAVWLWLKESRRWVRWLGASAFFLVVLQGILGGLRVTLYKDEIGIFHATLAQMFFTLLCSLALFTSAGWRRLTKTPIQLSSRLERGLLVATLLILGQLILGATMRHQHAGLAVPDFPLAYGKILPPTDAKSIEAINQHRSDVRDYKPVTAFQIVLHMTHRMVAFSVLLLVGWLAVVARRELRAGFGFARWMYAWVALIVMLALLGAATVWSNKAADVATAHVVLGALNLAFGSLLSIATLNCARLASKSVIVASEAAGIGSSLSPARSFVATR
ncbi:MAG: COX15/CtaA family protein [Verrucomicrobia bacterium]|nr:COX15/CtaA family protein [Verrucomicrobiota bacterium]